MTRSDLNHNLLESARITGPFTGIAGNIRPQDDVAPDGRFLDEYHVEETASPIAVILNWKPR